MSSIKPSNDIFALVDCNNFYASCERLFKPEWRNKPLVVLSNNDGCVVARSREAKELGIPMGAPAFQQQEVFRRHNVIVCSSNYRLYGNMSHRVMQTLQQFSSDVQIYSIDEAFLLLPADEAMEIAHKIQTTVEQWTGIPVSVGLGATKTLAKAANDWAKTHHKTVGLYALTDPDVIRKTLDQMPVQEIWGIGNRLANRLRAGAQIMTAWEFAQADDEWIRKHLAVTGLRTAWELRGVSCLELDESPAAKKSIISSRSFGRHVETLQDLEEAIAAYSARAAEKAREQDSVVSYIEVFVVIRTGNASNPFLTRHMHLQLPEPTAYTPIITQHAKQCIQRLFREGTIYKKAGITLGGLIPAQAIQPTLFKPYGSKQSKHGKLCKVVDALNAQYGKKSIYWAAEGIRQDWKMKQALCSGQDGLLTIRI